MQTDLTSQNRVLNHSLKHSERVETRKEFQFPNPLSQFVFTRNYPRWIESEKRRETFEETVDRYVSFIAEQRNLPKGLDKRIK